MFTPDMKVVCVNHDSVSCHDMDGVAIYVLDPFCLFICEVIHLPTSQLISCPHPPLCSNLAAHARITAPQHHVEV